MCADEIDVGMVVPNYDVFSGGVERTLKLLEYSDAGAIRYTAYLPRAGVPNREVGDAAGGLRAPYGLASIRPPFTAPSTTWRPSASSIPRCTTSCASRSSRRG